MPATSFRFLHASDLWMDVALGGVAEAPAHVRDCLVDARLNATGRLFEAAVREAVDFVVLAGNVVQPHLASPRVLLALVEHFRRLAKANIAVYWAAGRADPREAWPEWLGLPDNVHRFGRERVESIIHQRDGLALAKVLGVRADGSSPLPCGVCRADDSGLFTIGVGCGAANPAELEASGVHYWALGGECKRGVVNSGRRLAIYAGTHQAVAADQFGAHGATLVRVDASGGTEVTFLPTDVVRFSHQRLLVDDDATRTSLELLMRARADQLRQEASNVQWLARWTVAGDGRLPGQLRRGPLAAQLADWLRGEVGQTSPGVWTTQVAAETSSPLPRDWFEEDTIRGDYLRAARQYQTDTNLPIALEKFVGPAVLANVPGSEVTLSDPEHRRQALSEAATLGAELLTGEEPRP